MTSAPSLRLGEFIKGGGEGKVYHDPDSPAFAVKVYSGGATDRDEQLSKLQAMLANPPEDPTARSGHRSIAWPTQILYAPGEGHMVGFRMPLANTGEYVAAPLVQNPLDRQQKLTGFNWRYLHTAAANLASVVTALHARGYVIGDLKDENVLVRRTGQVMLVDCDSIQVPRPGGGYFRCRVGSPDFTPPELIGVDFGVRDRAPSSDNFALAVIVFKLVMEGHHPYACRWKDPDTDQTADQLIKRGAFPYPNGNILADPPLFAPPFDILAPEVQELFLATFSVGHSAPSTRPSAQQWLAALRRATDALRRCPLEPNHFYSPHLSSCYWCQRVRTIGFDSFSRRSVPTALSKPVATMPVGLPVERTAQIQVVANTLTSKYHKPSCRWEQRIGYGNRRVLTLRQAKDEFLTACRVCNPP